ncbi:hypothetical protein FJTKL_15440 [Diaporthe vaccinii]|uniref:Uncharacterized protein n=1 Tax=Diaporthe vaccinii TaxID=105482 RepID=A0ABR4E535_9PEZI
MHTVIGPPSQAFVRPRAALTLETVDCVVFVRSPDPSAAHSPGHTQRQATKQQICRLDDAVLLTGLPCLLLLL